MDILLGKGRMTLSSERRKWSKGKASSHDVIREAESGQSNV